MVYKANRGDSYRIDWRITHLRVVEVVGAMAMGDQSWTNMADHS